MRGGNMTRMGINSNLATAALNTNLMSIAKQLQDVRSGMGVANDAVRALLNEQLTANELAREQLAAARETNQHLTFLINGLIQAGTITPPASQ